MKKLSLLFIASTLFVATQCTPALEKEIEALDKILMTGHDEVMPKSMKLGDLKDDVLAKAADADSTTKSAAVKISNSLQTAEDDMYKWMDDYSAAMNDEQDKAKKLELYKTLKVEVDKVSADTDNAIKAAKDFLAQSEAVKE